MPARPTPFDLPLLIAGLPPALEAALSTAGVPVMPFDADKSRHAGGSAETAHRFLIYDSRSLSPAFIHNSQAAGMRTFDVAGYESAGLISRLKSFVETNAGTWLRIGELPFPYRNLRLDGEWMAGNERDFVWQARAHEFTRWWQARRDLQVRVQKRDDVYEIDCTGSPREFQPTLELWRGGHVATLPGPTGKITVSEIGIVFQRAVSKQGAGGPPAWVARLPESIAQPGVYRKAA